MNDFKRNLAIVSAFASIYVIWGTTYLAMRIAVETIPPFMMAGARFLSAGMVSYVILRMAGTPKPTWQQWRSGALIGCLLMVGGNGIVSWAEQRIPSGIAALIVATMPIWMISIDRFFYHGPRLHRLSILGLICGTFGLILLIGPTILGKDFSTFEQVSMIVVVFAPVFWSIGSLRSRVASLPENVFMSAAVQMISASLALCGLSILFGEPWRADYSAFSFRSLMATAYLAVFGSIIALSAYIWLLKEVTASRVATYTYVNPIIAVFLGWLLLGEAVSGRTLIACVSIATGVMLIVATKPLPRKRSPILPSVRNKPDRENAADHGCESTEVGAA